VYSGGPGLLPVLPGSFYPFRHQPYKVLRGDGRCGISGWRWRGVAPEGRTWWFGRRAGGWPCRRSRGCRRRVSPSTCHRVGCWWPWRHVAPELLQALPHFWCRGSRRHWWAVRRDCRSSQPSGRRNGDESKGASQGWEWWRRSGHAGAGLPNGATPVVRRFRRRESCRRGSWERYPGRYPSDFVPGLSQLPFHSVDFSLVVCCP